MTMVEKLLHELWGATISWRSQLVNIYRTDFDWRTPGEMRHIADNMDEILERLALAKRTELAADDFAVEQEFLEQKRIIKAKIEKWKTDYVGKPCDTCGLQEDKCICAACDKIQEHMEDVGLNPRGEAIMKIIEIGLAEIERAEKFVNEKLGKEGAK